MSQHEVERVIGRVATDPAFGAEVLNNAREACNGYDLTEEELEALEQLDSAGLADFASTLDNRL